MTDSRTRASWLVYALGALCAGAIVAAILVVGPASGSQAKITRTAKVATGVVQSTVSGSGNVQPASQLNLGFKTSGTVTNIYVKQGQQVTTGQLLATLDPQSAEVTLEQTKASLQSAEANLAKEEETDGEGSSSTGGSGSASASAGAATASAASVSEETHPAVALTAATPPTRTQTAATTPASSPAPATTTPATTPATTPTTTTPTSSTPTSKTQAVTAPAGKTPATKTTTKEASSSTTKTTVSTATREANLASARAAVKSDKLTVQSDEEAVQDTKLYAPQDGTIVSLSGQVGEVVSGSGTTKASAASSSSSTGSSSSTAGTGAAATGRSASSTGSAAASTGSSSTSSTAFAVLSDLSSMQLVVPLSESEVGNVKVGQIAAVTVEALEGRKLAAHVSEVSTLSTSNSGVVSYDVTFDLDQLTSGLKPGMSASAEVVVKQSEGINVPTTAISADTVTVVRSGKDVRQRVVTGLAGNSSTIILSGLKAGETVVLPSVSTTSATGTSSSSRRSALGGAAGGGGFAGGGAGGGAALFRGGG